jgi:peptide/nickel transport system substrate-binding protein
MDAVMFGEAKPLFGAPSNTPSDTTWPSPTGYRTDVARARSLLVEAGMADGFETMISLDAGQGTLSEPIAVLVQESLAALNIRTTIEKIPGSNWRGEMLKKSMPFMINFFSGWLDYPEYFFFFTYHGQNAVFNTMGYKNPGLDQLIDTARSLAASGDRPAYEATVKKMITLGYDQAPRIPLFQPYLSVASQKSIGGYAYWFHRQLDYRSLTKSA